MAMRCLVVVAHPVAESLCGSLFRMAVATLGERHEVDTIDLCADGFDPRMSREERLGYHDRALLPPELSDYAARLARAEVVVFCFPVWSYGVPAVLKGFFDRVLRPGYAFHLDGGRVRPGLVGIRRIVTIATYGQTRLAARWIGDPPRRQMTRFLPLCCGAGVRSTYLAHYHINKGARAGVDRFCARAEAALRRI